MSGLLQHNSSVVGDDKMSHYIEPRSDWPILEIPDVWIYLH